MTRITRYRSLDFRKPEPATAAHWWLSFRDPSRRDGHSFVGAAIVPIETDEIADAADEARRLGCNPGGEVLGHPLGHVAGRIPASMIGRLLSADEARTAVQMIEGGAERPH
jgi:hypothetical protein